MTATTPGQQKSSESLADKIKNNLLVVLIGVVATSVGLGVTFTKLASDAKLERTQRDDQAQISELKQSLGNIQRNVAGDQGYIDVGNVLVDQDAASKLGRAKFYPDESYYALADGADSPWHESMSNEYQLLVDTVGAADATSVIDAKTAKQMRRLPVRVWRKGEKHEITLPGADGGTLTLYPEVFVERVSPEQILTLVPKADRPVYAQVYEDEPTGLTLIQQLLLQIPSQQQFRAKLVSVQKKQNVGYARYESRFTNVTVDGRKAPTYYLTQETVVISTGGQIYLVRTELPRAEPRSEDAAWMTRWFNALHIVSD